MEHLTTGAEVKALFAKGDWSADHAADRTSRRSSTLVHSIYFTKSTRDRKNTIMLLSFSEHRCVSVHYPTWSLPLPQYAMNALLKKDFA
jgi:hypothetical protein